MRTRSPRTVQQMQPLFISNISSCVDSVNGLGECSQGTSDLGVKLLLHKRIVNANFAELCAARVRSHLSPATFGSEAHLVLDHGDFLPVLLCQDVVQQCSFP